jgi:hypothetical protein
MSEIEEPKRMKVTVDPTPVGGKFAFVLTLDRPGFPIEWFRSPNMYDTPELAISGARIDFIKMLEEWRKTLPPGVTASFEVQ